MPVPLAVGVAAADALPETLWVLLGEPGPLRLWDCVTLLEPLWLGVALVDTLCVGVVVTVPVRVADTLPVPVVEGDADAVPLMDTLGDGAQPCLRPKMRMPP